MSDPMPSQPDAESEPESDADAEPEAQTESEPGAPDPRLLEELDEHIRDARAAAADAQTISSAD